MFFPLYDPGRSPGIRLVSDIKDGHFFFPNDIGWQIVSYGGSDIGVQGHDDGVSENHVVWVVSFRNQAILPVLAEQCRPLMAKGKIIVQNLRIVDYGNLRPWTDNRSDLLALMRSNIRLRKGIVSRRGETQN